MKLEDLLDPQDAPALYFMRQTTTLRARCDALALALMAARELLENPNAGEDDANRVYAIINRTLEAA